MVPCSMCIAAALSAQTTPKEVKQFLRMLQAAPDFPAVIDSLQRRDYHPDSANIDVFRQALWQRLLEDGNRHPERREAFEHGRCMYGDGRDGRFTMKLKGVAPANGYPVYIALHGGGGGTAEMNDSQWEAMQTYYLGSIDTGIYVAPRGPNNTWNLHFDADAQAFYIQLLRDLRLFAGADPNRIYLLGYSAGGDGVYQLAPRLAPELAAANMSAGHHNGVSAVNLQHLPMLLQVGELDGAYDRNRATVQYGNLLDSLGRLAPSWYINKVWVHAGKEHSYVADHQGARHEATILHDPKRWLADPTATTTRPQVTDAPTWLRQWVRDPWPAHVIWDSKTSIPGNRWWYWLSLPEALRLSTVDIEYYTGKNGLMAMSLPDGLEIGLHERMIHPSKEVRVDIGYNTFKIKPKPSALKMARQLLVTADPSYAFWQVLRVRRDASGKYQIE